METFKLASIETAIQDFKDGKLVIVVDDEDRENEGDLITAAELVTPEKVNFMLTYGRGVLCAPSPLTPVTASACPIRCRRTPACSARPSRSRSTNSKGARPA